MSITPTAMPQMEDMTTGHRSENEKAANRYDVGYKLVNRPPWRILTYERCNSVV